MEENDVKRGTAAEGSARPADPAQVERQALQDLLLETVREQRARRRWGIFFKLLGLGYLTVVLAWIGDLVPSWGFLSRSDAKAPHTAMIAVDGEIEADSPTNADNMIGALQAAFDDAGTRAVVLRINSPGGSPVQAGMVYDEIQRQRASHPGVPVYAVIEEIGASGAYYIAAAADEIYVNKASIVGSVGVLIDGFGFTGAMQKLGVERRLLTAGTNKAILDPFSPLSDAHRRHAQSTIDEVHRQFIDAVRTGRGDRLKETPDMFSGLFWTGATSVELGLADGFGSVDSVARDIVEAPDVIDYTRQDDLLDRVARRLGTRFAKSFRAAVREPSWR
ncbi:MAG TPA: S49 family peptidase [Burkholderiaceae bacterium]|nr:S49 family peptidase [Burkholderiaceae bacterium]